MSRVHLLFLAGCLFGSLLAACGEDPSATGACQQGDTKACLCPDSSTSTQMCVGGGFGACSCGPGGSAFTPTGGLGMAGAGGQVAAVTPPGELTDLPCDVATVLDQSCWSCHGTQLQFGAPMRLVTHADFQAMTPTNPAVPVYQEASVRIQADAAPMPPPPNDRLEAGALGVLNSWLTAGAAAGAGDVCAGLSTGTETTEGGTGTGMGAGFMPTTELPEGTECYEFRAHAAGTDAGYPVPGGTKDSYVNFTFAPPWTGTPQAVSFRNITDNMAVIHHWLLYQNNGSVQDGGISPSSGTHGADELVAGWAPGATDNVLPPDVGMALGTGFTVEIHYNNTGGDTTDSSGVEVCVNHNPRPNTAGLHWLGTEAIFLGGAGQAGGDCSPRTDMGPITILSSWPHMHLKGTHQKTTVTRQAGGTEVLLDEPFSFDYQRAWDTPTVINPGDKLNVTCTFNAATTFGPGTSEEMCYNFVLAYPNGGLTSTALFGGGLTSSVNHCFQ